MKQPPSFTNTPRIVLVVNDRLSLKQIEKVKRAGVSILEIRLDQFRTFDAGHIHEQLHKFKKAGLPLLGTVRSQKEGGHRTLSESQRKTIFREIIPHMDWVDLELSSKTLLPFVLTESRKHKTGLVLSFHDFKKTPPLSFLEKLLELSRPYRPNLLKISTHARNREEVLRLLEFTLKHRRRGLVTLSMGAIGALSRVFFGSVGSQWTYAFLSKPSAPGQLPLAELSPLVKRFYPG